MKQCEKKVFYIFLYFFASYSVSPAGADLRGASPAAARRWALLRSAGMLGVNGQVWLISLRFALGRNYKTSLRIVVTTRAQGVRGKRETGVSYRKQPRIAEQCNMPRSGGDAPYKSAPEGAPDLFGNVKEIIRSFSLNTAPFTATNAASFGFFLGSQKKTPPSVLFPRSFLTFLPQFPAASGRCPDRGRWPGGTCRSGRA